MTETRLSGLLIKTDSIPTYAIENFSGNVTASLPIGTVSSSTQVTALLPGGAISSSTQVNYTQLQNIPSGIASSSAQVTAYLPTGVASSSAQIKEYLPTDAVSSSAQVTAFLPTGTVSSSGQVSYTGLSNIPSGIASSSAQVKAYLPSDTVSSSVQVTAFLPTGTVSASNQVSYTGLSNIPSGIASSSTQVTSYLPTGTVSSSGQITLSDISGTTFSNNNFTFPLNVNINGLLTATSQSVSYVSSSQLNVGSNDIILNTSEQLRFGGLTIFDSGSAGQSGSLFWDSLHNVWLYVHAGTSNTSSILITGPENTGTLGSEAFLSQNIIPKAGTAGDHIVNSQISDNGTTVGMTGNLSVTGSVTANSSVLRGSTSGTVTVQAAATAGTTTITFPATTGTVVTTGDTSTVTNTMLAGSIANAKLANSTISGISLGSNLATLTIGSGLTGTSYNGSTAVTISISSGAITNAMLANSTISGISLGSNLATLTLNTSGTGLSGNTTYNGSGAATFTVTSNATSANTGGAIVARDGSGNFSAGTITATLSGNASTATSAGTVTGASGQLLYKDDRIIEPNSITSGYLQFGFTSFANNNTSPWADYLHLRSYTDGSGGADNLVVFSRSSIAMRIYQQTWNSGTAYSSYKDVAFTDSNITGTAAAWTTARTITIGSTGKSVNGTADVSWTLSEIGAYSNTNPSGYTTNTGTVTSVSGTGTASGLSLSGTVTTSGNITLSGTVNSLAAGTYAISISGNAATATTAGSITSQANSATITAATAATANTIALRDSGGDITGRYIFSVHFNQSSSNSENPSIAAFWTNSSSDNYNRKSTPAHVISQLGLLTTSNYSSYAIPVGGGINMSGGFGLNDQKLYLRTNGDTNHYIWNAADDWEELVFYTGTGFRIAGSNGNPYAYVSVNGLFASSLNTYYYNGNDGIFFFRYGSTSGVTRHINLSNSTTDPSAASIDTGISWGQRSDSSAYYMIYCTQENYNGNYNKLTLNWHTGIRIGASTYYGGTTFYDNSLNISSTILFSVGRGDSNVRASNTFYAGGDVVAYSSDARLKENIKPIDNPIEKIMKLNGIYYTWKDMVTGIGFTPTQKEEVGVLAQEVQEVLPEVVTAAPFDCEIDPPTGKTHSKSGQNYLTVKYEKLVPLLIEAIKEQQTTIQKLNSRIEALESK